MSRRKPRDEMADYTEQKEFIDGVSTTTNGLLVNVSNYGGTTELRRIFSEYGWVIDQIHWESQMFHIVPEEVLIE